MVHKALYLKDIFSQGYVDTLAWIHDVRSSNECVILVLRDSSDVVEVKICSEKWLPVLKNLTRESLVRIKGFIKSDHVLEPELVDIVIRAPPTIPIDVRSPLPDDVKTFTRYSYLVIRSPKYSKVFKVQQWIMYYSREFLLSRGFVELLPPMIGPCSDPGLRGARKLQTRLYGHLYELMSSVIMFKQASVAALEKVFFMARNVREEPPENLHTGRHLCEFTQLDLEWAFATMDDVMKLAEDLIVYVMTKVKERCKDIIEELNPYYKVPRTPFRRLRYVEAVEELKKLGVETPEGKEFTQEGERALSQLYEEPIWITHYPVISRGFYYLPDPEDPRFNRDFNLLLPRGFGEVIDGGEREYRAPEIRKRIEALGEPIEKYTWFLELAEIGIPPSAGFGLGIERFTRYVLNLKYIWEAAPFPKVPGVVPSP